MIARALMKRGSLKSLNKHQLLRVIKLRDGIRPESTRAWSQLEMSTSTAEKLPTLKKAFVIPPIVTDKKSTKPKLAHNDGKTSANTASVPPVSKLKHVTGTLASDKGTACATTDNSNFNELRDETRKEAAALETKMDSEKPNHDHKASLQGDQIQDSFETSLSRDKSIGLMGAYSSIHCPKGNENPVDKLQTGLLSVHVKGPDRTLESSTEKPELNKSVPRDEHLNAKKTTNGWPQGKSKENKNTSDKIRSKTDLKLVDKQDVPPPLLPPIHSTKYSELHGSVNKTVTSNAHACTMECTDFNAGKSTQEKGYLRLHLRRRKCLEV